MPRKKPANNKKSQIQKQKIEARLLEISFKADDYIYKKKSIPVEHAKKYLEEVQKFEPKCQGDVRSLQVIEKLTHLMKIIIEQGKHSQCTSEVSYNPFNITSTNASTTSDTTAKSTRSTHAQTNKSFEIRNIIDYLEDTGEFSKSKSERMQIVQTDVNIDLERTLSNLSLSIIDAGNKEIVENIDNLTHIDDINLIPTPNVRSSVHLNENSTISTGVCDEVSTHTNRNEQQRNTINKTSPDIIMIDLVNDDDDRHSFVNNKVSNIAPTDKNAVNHIIDSPQKPDILVNQIDARKRKDIKVLEKVGNKEKRYNKPRKARRNSKGMDTILSKGKSESKIRRRKKNSKEIVCDLSWVENLHFVRVIEPSEYDTSLEESFWDNCYLPYDFSPYF